MQKIALDACLKRSWSAKASKFFSFDFAVFLELSFAGTDHFLGRGWAFSPTRKKKRWNLIGIPGVYYKPWWSQSRAVCGSAQYRWVSISRRLSMSRWVQQIPLNTGKSLYELILAAAQEWKFLPPDFGIWPLTKSSHLDRSILKCSEGLLKVWVHQNVGNNIHFEPVYSPVAWMQSGRTHVSG